MSSHQENVRRNLIGEWSKVDCIKGYHILSEVLTLIDKSSFYE